MSACLAIVLLALAVHADVGGLGYIVLLLILAPGYFTVRVRSDFATIRTPLITLDERKRAIASLPHVSCHLTAADRLMKLRKAPGMVGRVAAFARSDATDAGLGAALQPLPASVEAGDAAAQVKHPTRAAVEVADAERADRGGRKKGLRSRRQVARQVFGSPGGKGYSKVKQVCDKLGLLIGAVELDMLEA